MAELFSDGFESGSASAWDVSFTQAGGTNSFTAGAARSGSYGFSSYSDGSSASWAAVYNNSHDSTTDYWEGQCYFKFSAALGAAPDANSTFISGRIEALAVGHFGIRVGTAGKVQWTIRKRDGTAGVVVQSDLGDPPTDWTQVRVIRDTSGANVDWTLWYAGSSYTTTDTSSGTEQNIDGLMLGWNAANLGTGGGTIYFDDAKEYDAAPSTSYTLTPGVGSVSYTGQAPTIRRTLGMGVGSVGVTGLAPLLLQGVGISVPIGSVALTGLIPTLQILASWEYARPIADLLAGGWTPSTGTDLYAMIDEDVASDTDYDRSGATPVNDTALLTLTPVGTPGAGTVTLSIRGRTV